MNKFETRDEAFASQDFDPTKVEITGVPAHIIDFAKAAINLAVIHDAVNPTFKPDGSDFSQPKYTAWHEMGSPSGAGFAYFGYAYWLTYSHVGARLSSESAEAAEHIADIAHEDYEKFKVYDRKVD